VADSSGRMNKKFEMQALHAGLRQEKPSDEVSISGIGICAP